MFQSRLNFFKPLLYKFVGLLLFNEEFFAIFALTCFAIGGSFHGTEALEFLLGIAILAYFSLFHGFPTSYYDD